MTIYMLQNWRNEVEPLFFNKPPKNKDIELEIRKRYGEQSDMLINDLRSDFWSQTEVEVREL